MTATEANFLPHNGGSVDNATAEDASEDDLHQDVVSQFTLLNGYTHVLFGFQIQPETSRDAIVDALRGALSAISQKIPWLRGQMMHVPSPKRGDSGSWKPASWPADIPENGLLRVADCDELLPPMTQILRAGAPMSMLKGDVLTPWPGLPVPHGLDPPLPVMALQASFVKGGLLLNLSTHHMAIDASGLIQLLRLLATVLCGRDMAPAELEQANRARSHVIPLIPRGEPMKDCSFLRRPAGWTPNPPASTPRWCMFKIPVATLPTLRKAATPQSPGESERLPNISDNDIMCALCWQCIARVRLARGYHPDTPVKFTRAIDGRATLGVPLSYLGHMAFHSIAQLPLSRVAEASLSSVTQILRRALSAANTTWGFRSYATFLAREPDKSMLVYGGLRDVNLDLGATSVSAGDEGGSEAGMPGSFGPLLGPSCFLRRPDGSPITSTITITPAEGGALPVCVCLPEDDLDGLKKDGEWRRYTRLVG